MRWANKLRRSLDLDKLLWKFAEADSVDSGSKATTETGTGASSSISPKWEDFFSIDSQQNLGQYQRGILPRKIEDAIKVLKGSLTSLGLSEEELNDNLIQLATEAAGYGRSHMSLGTDPEGIEYWLTARRGPGGISLSIIRSMNPDKDIDAGEYIKFLTRYGFIPRMPMLYNMPMMPMYNMPMMPMYHMPMMPMMPMMGYFPPFGYRI